MSRITTLIIQIRGLIALLTTTHEPPRFLKVTGCLRAAAPPRGHEASLHGLWPRGALCFGLTVRAF